MQKGPEHVPDSMLVLLYAFGLLLLATFVSGALVATPDRDSILFSFLSSILGYALYWIVLLVAGFTRRFVPTVASIMACGSILTMMMVAAAVLLTPFLGAPITSIVVWLILFWSVPVKGHIIARAIERHWYVGISIALAIFVMQYVSYLAMTNRPTT